MSVRARPRVAAAASSVTLTHWMPRRPPPNQRLNTLSATASPMSPLMTPGAWQHTPTLTAGDGARTPVNPPAELLPSSSLSPSRSPRLQRPTPRTPARRASRNVLSPQRTTAPTLTPGPRRASAFNGPQSGLRPPAGSVATCTVPAAPSPQCTLRASSARAPSRLLAQSPAAARRQRQRGLKVATLNARGARTKGQALVRLMLARDLPALVVTDTGMLPHSRLALQPSNSHFHLLHRHGMGLSSGVGLLVDTSYATADHLAYAAPTLRAETKSAVNWFRLRVAGKNMTIAAVYIPPPILRQRPCTESTQCCRRGVCRADPRTE